MAIIFRPLQLDDFSRGYQTLLEQLAQQPLPLTEELFQERFAEFPGQTIVGVDVDNNRLVAHGTIFIMSKLHYPNRVGMVEDIVVHSEYQRQGLGQRLMQVLLDYGTEQGCYKLQLYCHDQLKSFYEKSDYHEAGVQLKRWTTVSDVWPASSA